nr:ankyrin repeat domain-containing protein [Wolbachia endosymbiont of Ctenocephalides felis wCfeT]
MLANGANIYAKDKYGSTPLHFAAEKGNKEIVELLIKAGADVSAKDYLGTTPLLSAIENGHIECSKTLIRYIVLKNPEAIKSSYITSNAELFELWDYCQYDVLKMQNEKIGNSDVSLYQFLREIDKSKLVGYLLDKHSCLWEELEKDLYIERFPYTYPMYGGIIEGMIESQYNKGKASCPKVLRNDIPSRMFENITCELVGKQQGQY